MLNDQRPLQQIGLDGVALKPLEVDLTSLESLPTGRATVDYEGAAALPGAETLERLAGLVDLRVTVPVRADGFDPIGDDRRWAELPAGAELALVAGNPAYLEEHERRRPIAPRLRAALDRAPDAWVGTEGIERVAMATGAAQFELLGPATERRVRDLRAVGFDGDVAVYAPTVLSDDEDAVLDALGPYVARRRRVARSLPADATTDAAADGRAREILLSAADEFGIVGDVTAARGRITALRDAGVDHVVGYPARGLAEFAAR
ncbi:MAG: luciferase [Halobacteriales archaeon]|nr:luciferase [Halobacteriales archaeon]